MVSDDALKKRLLPRNGRLYVVRWVRRDGRDVCHRYFRRERDALRFANRVQRYREAVAVFSTDTHWTARWPRP